jgi:TolB-like protein/Tfp pilus assembly protein PilF
MAGQPSTEFHLEIAHILFIDTVGYSKLRTSDQRQVQNILNEVVRASTCFRAAERAGKLVRLPTGDGMALVFNDRIESPINCALEISKTIRAHPGLQLRMGIHSGPIARLSDVNDQSNVAGAAMNMAERIMSCGEANHILLSKRAADDLAEFDRWRPYLHELGECEGKHGSKLNVVNFYTEEFGNPDLPARFQTGAIKTRAQRQSYLSSKRHRVAAGGLAFLLLAVCVIFALLHAPRPPIAGPRSLIDANASSAKSIAVLPFESLGGDNSDLIFADGVQDEILTDLGKVAALKVISRTSTLPFRARAQRNLREIGEVLGAGHLVEGTVQRAGRRVRLNVQLIDARSDSYVWTESYDRAISDTFALESELAEKIVAQLKAKLTPEEKAAIKEQSTSDQLARDLYTEAKSLISAPLFNLQGTQDLFEAAELLEKAVARDPHYFLAYCRLVSVHDQIYLNGPDHTPARLALAAAALKNAQRLRPDAGETHLALADYLYSGFRDYDGARKELEKARRSLPNEPSVFEFAGFIDRRQNRWEESMRSLQRALELDPRGTYYMQQIAVSYQFLRRFDDAAAMIDRALAILPNDPSLRIFRASYALHATADTKPMHAALQGVVEQNRNAAAGVADEWFFLALCERDLPAANQAIDAMTAKGYSNQGVPFPRAWCEGFIARMAGDSAKEQAAFVAARAEIEKGMGDDEAQALCSLAMIDAALGRKEQAIREGRRAVELLPPEKNSLNGALAIEYLAVTYAWTGETELALDALKTATSIPGDVSYGQLRLHPFWDALRGDPRFEKIVASLAPKPEKR